MNQIEISLADDTSQLNQDLSISKQIDLKTVHTQAVGLHAINFG